MQGVRQYSVNQVGILIISQSAFTQIREPGRFQTVELVIFVDCFMVFSVNNPAQVAVQVVIIISFPGWAIGVGHLIKQVALVIVIGRNVIFKVLHIIQVFLTIISISAYPE